MKVFTNLLFKVTLSSMVLTAPAMISGNAGGSLLYKEAALPFYSSAVIKNFIDHLTVGPLRAYAAFRAEKNGAAPATLENSSGNTAVKLKSTTVVRTYIVRKTEALPVRVAEAPVVREGNSTRLYEG